MTRGWLLLATLAGLAPGCGFADEDVTTVRFELTPVRYGLDTRLLHVPPEFWRLRCDTNPNVCCQTIDCAVAPLVCRDGACVNDFHFESYGTIDLRMQQPALSRVGAARVADFYLSHIRYDVNNQLNIALPALDLYVAPVEITSSADPAAQKFGIMPAVGAKTAVKNRQVRILSDSRQLFARYARDWQAFNLIIVAPVVVQSTMAPLAGSATMDVTIEVSGSLGL